MSVDVKNLANASEQSVAEKNASDNRDSPELIEKGIKANLEPLNERILNLT